VRIRNVCKAAKLLLKTHDEEKDEERAEDQAGGEGGGGGREFFSRVSGEFD
jgi:hypothetical protein